MTHGAFAALLALVLLLMPPGRAGGEPPGGKGTAAVAAEADRREAGPLAFEVRQRPGSERVEHRPHGMEVQWEDPDWIYASPEDAERMRGRDSALPEDAPRRELSPPPPPSPLERAWALYRAGRFSEAESAFRGLLEGEKTPEARLGLAYSLIRRGKRRDALVLLDGLLREGFRPLEVRRARIGLLLAEERFAEAGADIERLPEREREAARRRLLELRLQAALRSLPPLPEAAAVKELLRLHREALERCIRPDLFHGLARALGAAGEGEAAAALARRLLDCPLDPSLRLGILAGLVSSGDEEEALALVASQRELLAPLDPQAAATLEAIEANVLTRRLARLPEGSAARLETATRLLALRPDDPHALAALAWERLRRGEAAEADRLFTRLLELDPQNRDAALGAGWARLQAGREGEALAPFASGAIAEDERVRELRRTVLRRRADRAMAEGRWEEAAAAYEALLRLEPENREAADALARALMRRGPNARDLAFLEERAEHDPSPGIVSELLEHYRASGSEDRAWDLACRAAANPETAIAAAAAPFFFAEGLPVTASQLDPEGSRCYRNAFAPRAEAFVLHRSRETRGRFGDLEETSFPLSAFHAVGLGKTASLTLTPRLLRGRQAGDAPPVGRDYRGLPLRQEWEDELFVLQPDAGILLEGRIPAALHVGTTPLGGPVSAEPTFTARLGHAGGFLEAHRLSVRDSILSWTGQKDPYSKGTWGRVTRLGLEGGKAFTLEGVGWLSATAGFDHYDGREVIENQAVHGGLAAGRTRLVDGNEWSGGAFLSLAHFRRNSDFYTFGHGGYYSPQLMTLLGPFARVRTAACRDFWIDLQLSAGWLHQRLHQSDRYPLEDREGRYGADTDNRLGASLRVQGMKLLTPHVAVGGLASFGSSGDWTEWRIGAGVEIFFEPQNAFWTRRDLFREFGASSNR